ncbi:MAG: hypothetical protein HJJLKODD_02841 [Phycisphaerae bacterium]|nr:hypothetical protein [Phycisphaerae bacterium]
MDFELPIDTSYMPRRLRNKILIWLIGLGLLNCLLFTVVYAYIGGDALNGKVVDSRFYVRGHFLRDAGGQATEVSQAVWIYSFVHAISIWPTIGGVLCSMLVLARPHIIATMQEEMVIRGGSFVSAAMTLILIVTGASTVHFVIDFIRAMMAVGAGHNFGP